MLTIPSFMEKLVFWKFSSVVPVCFSCTLKYNFVSLLLVCIHTELYVICFAFIFCINIEKKFDFITFVFILKLLQHALPLSGEVSNGWNREIFWPVDTLYSETFRDIDSSWIQIQNETERQFAMCGKTAINDVYIQ